MLFILTQQPSLQRKYVIEDAVDAAPLESMGRDQAGFAEQLVKVLGECAGDALLPTGKGIFDQLQAAVESAQPGPDHRVRHPCASPGVPFQVSIPCRRLSTFLPRLVSEPTGGLGPEK